jgi:hypothetical protein
MSIQPVSFAASRTFALLADRERQLPVLTPHHRSPSSTIETRCTWPG